MGDPVDDGNDVLGFDERLEFRSGRREVDRPGAKLRPDVVQFRSPDEPRLRDVDVGFDLEPICADGVDRRGVA